MRPGFLPRGMGVSLLALVLCGCHHKPVQATLPPQVPPQAVEPEAPPMLSPPMVATAPPDVKPDTGPHVVVKKPRAPKKKTPAATPGGQGSPAGAAPGGTQVAANGGSPGGAGPANEAESSPIGALSPGGDAAPQAKKDAADLIAAIVKGIDAVPADVAQRQKAGINKVRQFVRQAQKALDSGDAEGAKTLAVKAKLLLDDVAK